MHDSVGNAYWGAVGKVLDQQIARLKTGMKCRYPLEAAALGMSDALDEIGKDRLLPRGGTTPGAGDESDSSYAARLVAAWETWAMAGQPRALLLALKVAGFPVHGTGPLGTTGCMLVNHIGTIYGLDSSDNLITSTAGVCANRTNLHGVIPVTKLHGFTLDARDQFFSHFMLIFLQDVPGLDNADGNVIKACLNQTTKLWRCRGAIYNGAAVVPSGAKVWGWPAPIKWGDTGLKWGANGARFIDPE
jgi:hypothetical protein